MAKECQVKLSILIPAFNERYFVGQTIEKALSVQLPPGMQRELVIVDDASTDGTQSILKNFAKKYPNLIQLHLEKINRGKGAAIRSAIQHATGDILIVQDADLEYDPEDYGRLIRPILNGDADVVYGSRFLPNEYRRVFLFWHAVGNKILTTFSNMFTGLDLTDMETGYKVAKSGLLKSIPIRSNRFGVEPELTAKFAKRGCRIYEVPISYRGRGYDEGKKITWRDGVKAFVIIVFFWAIDDIYDSLYGHAILHRLSRAHRFNGWMADVVTPWVGENVCEIGAGIGNLTQKFRPRQSYTATEVDSLHLDYLKNRFGDHDRVDVRKNDVEKSDDFHALEGRFDTVVCLNVIEHVKEDKRALENIYRALIPGGTAIILVPQGKWLYGSLDRAVDHVRRYTRNELVQKFEETGFEVQEVFSFNRAGLWPWFVNGRIFRRRSFGRWQLKVFDHLVWFWRILEKLLPWPGLSIIGIAKKPGPGES